MSTALLAQSPAVWQQGLRPVDLRPLLLHRDPAVRETGVRLLAVFGEAEPSVGEAVAVEPASPAPQRTPPAPQQLPPTRGPEPAAETAEEPTGGRTTAGRRSRSL